MKGAVRFDLEAEQAELIGYASSGDDGKVRWTELRVWYLHAPEHAQRDRRWITEARGCSTLPGERDRVRQMRMGSLERALKLFDESDLGIMASEQAREWAETTSPGAVTFVESPYPLFTTMPDKDGKSFGFGKTWIPQTDESVVRESRTTEPETCPAALTTDAQALEWLYRGQTEGHKATFATMFARDFGVPVRTVQVALERGTGIRVPLLAVIPFLDRERFLKSREEKRDDQ